MARGKVIEVVYRTGAGTDRQAISATLMGGDVYAEYPVRPTDLFVVVKEIDRNAHTIREARFDKNSVIAVLEGQLPPQKQKKAK